MVFTYEHVPGRIVAKKDGVAFFDTDVYPVQFWAPANEILWSGTVTFPDFTKSNIYNYARATVTGTDYQGCVSYLTLPWQEWGPSDMDPAPSYVGYELADVVLGTVPAGTDLLLVEVKMSRTTVPDQILGNTIPVLFKEGEWVLAPGGSLPTEYLNPMARHMSIELAGTPNVDGTINVLLRRKMSVRKNTPAVFNSGNNGANTGWTYGGTDGQYGNVIKLRDAKNGTWGGSNTMSRSGASACSVVDNTSFTSVYTGDIRITPGRSAITPDTNTNTLFLAYAGNKYLSFAASSTCTITGVPIAAPHATRRVIVHISGNPSAVAARNVTAVTIGGISATVVCTEDYGNGGAVGAIAIADVPTGTSASIAITFSGSMVGAVVNVFVAYNLASAGADASFALSGNSATQTLTTVASGVAIAVVYAQGAVDATYSNLTGIDSVTKEDQSGLGNWWISYGFQYTTGASLSLRNNPTAGVFTAASFH